MERGRWRSRNATPPPPHPQKTTPHAMFRRPSQGRSAQRSGSGFTSIGLELSFPFEGTARWSTTAITSCMHFTTVDGSVRGWRAYWNANVRAWPHHLHQKRRRRRGRPPPSRGPFPILRRRCLLHCLLQGGGPNRSTSTRPPPPVRRAFPLPSLYLLLLLLSCGHRRGHHAGLLHRRSPPPPPPPPPPLHPVCFDLHRAVRRHHLLHYRH